jgi:hypothetical protein
VLPINDPAWIKRGMGGRASEDGSWRRRVESSEIPNAVESLVSVYLNQCDDVYRRHRTAHGRYAGRKREAARVYLLYYFVEFRDGCSQGIPGGKLRAAPHPAW